MGAIWAIFYAYFFWSTFSWPPALAAKPGNSA
jgi:hypothetical protein